jgi:hypothetical protein
MAMTSQSRYYRLRYLIRVWFDDKWWSVAAFDNKAAAISYFKELKSLPADTQRYELLRRDNKDCWIAIDI